MRGKKAKNSTSFTTRESGLVDYSQRAYTSMWNLWIVKIDFFGISNTNGDFNMNWKQGSGPDRGRSPVEWVEILSICPSVRPSIPPEA